jgi:3-keto-disaccharide hydrolase
MIRPLQTLIWVLCSLTAGAVPAPGQATKPAALIDTSLPRPDVPLPPGMTPLFDGKTLGGWAQVPPDSWTVQDGIIASRGVGRGVLYTANSYGNYRVIFDMRHVSGKPDHQACVLFFGSAPAAGEKPLDALGAVQIQVPVGYTWDYRKGHNNAGKGEFTSRKHPKYDVRQWSRVELLINATMGTARMAVAQPVGGDSVEVVDFNVPDAGRIGPFGLQMHNKGLFDQYTNIAIEVNPARNDLITLGTNR